ncbi:DUF4192 domain-containing protein [Georgenia wangjunii]|uniref:DUF4192 domain-containing protein n=1 Tax=Georgenia wangjunii TaxID=3117730 RepID=UPI002F262D9F
MDTETVFRISEPRELLAYIPYRLGFRPRESLVLLSLRQPRNRLGLVIRADLVDVGHAVVGRHVANGLVDHLRADGARYGVAVVYSEHPREELARDPLVVRALQNLRTVSDWFGPPGPWVVGPQGFGCWGDGVECDPAAAPLRELESTQVGAAMVLHGRAVVENREELAVERSKDGPRRRAAVRAASAARRHYREVRRRCGGGAPGPGAAFGPARGTAAAPQPHAVLDEAAAGAGEVVKGTRSRGAGRASGAAQAEMVAWRLGETERWERLLALATGPDELPAAELGRMLVGLSDVVVRDAIILSMVGPLPPWLDRDEAAAWALRAVFEPGGPPPPDEATTRAAFVLRETAANAARGGAAPALVLLAWLAWWEGEGARADVLALQCLAEHPGHRLASLVSRAVQCGLPPGWVRQG